MRIIGGEARGRRLFAPDGTDTRPTSDKTREALFNILRNRIYGSRVLDLFGGTGALALEALSRGASFAAICDCSPAAVRVIQRNAETVLKDEIAERVRILRADYMAALERLAGQKFDLVFLDPPYAMTDAYGKAVRFLLNRDMLNQDAVAVLERKKDNEICLPPEAEVYDERAYRDTVIAFVRRRCSE